MTDGSGWGKTARVDSAIRKLWAIAIVGLAAAALLVLLFAGRSDRSRAVRDTGTASGPAKGVDTPAPTTPAPPAVPETR